MTRNQLCYALTLIITSAWLASTLVIDIMIVPAVFRNISSFFEAGDLGIKVFSSFNKVEVVLGLLLLGTMAWQHLKGKKSYVSLIIAVLLWAISLSCIFWLTPKIIVLTDLWRRADEMGLIGIAGINDVQETHQFYHGLYVKLDVAKALLLSTLLLLSIRREIRAS